MQFCLGFGGHKKKVGAKLDKITRRFGDFKSACWLRSIPLPLWRLLMVTLYPAGYYMD